MNNKEEASLSKFSYTNKDFASIYPDLLDLATKLTNKWHPANSNESDPGVVLLKEGAFVADHLNYNTDKNILEGFLPTATQESSVRNLVQMGGYIPNYYVSATGLVSFNYDFGDLDPQVFTIPTFTLNISDAEGTISFIQDEPLMIDNKGNGQCRFIQGYISDLEIDGVKNITMENIDDNNRLYLPVSNVAQNGVYIRNSDLNENLDWSVGLWERENYLNTLPTKSKAYKLEYDSDRNEVYIEFPSDIAEIIGAGLNIKYIVTEGLRGNISAGFLSTIVSPEVYTSSLDVKFETKGFSVINPSSFENGKDPETIEEMYQNFKEVVGTFNTLVTCKDYSNAIKQMEDENNTRVVSNAVVTDTTNDYNNSLKVISYDSYGKYIEQGAMFFGPREFKGAKSSNNTDYSIGDVTVDDDKLYWWDGSDWEEITDFRSFVRAKENMSNNDLKLCALIPFISARFDVKKPWKSLEVTYRPVLGKETLTSEENSQLSINTSTDNIKESLADYKCISTSFKPKYDGEVYYFKVKTPLDIQVTTYNKIMDEEIFKEIKSNICFAIAQNFNSSMLEFGEELNLDEVYEVILNSDERIKNVYISQRDEDTSTYAVINDGEVYYSESDITDLTKKYRYGTNDSYLLLDLISKNILAGRLCLFNFIDEFSYNYGQKGIDISGEDQTNLGIRPVVNNIKKINTFSSMTATRQNPTTSQEEDISYVIVSASGSPLKVLGYSFRDSTLPTNKDSILNYFGKSGETWPGSLKFYKYQNSGFIETTWDILKDGDNCLVSASSLDTTDLKNNDRYIQGSVIGSSSNKIISNIYKPIKIKPEEHVDIRANQNNPDPSEVLFDSIQLVADETYPDRYQNFFELDPNKLETYFRITNISDKNIELILINTTFNNSNKTDKIANEFCFYLDNNVYKTGELPGVGNDITGYADIYNLLKLQRIKEYGSVFNFNIPEDKTNHYLYIATPNFIDSFTFPVYCYYRLFGSSDFVIPENIDTVLPEGTTLDLLYKKDNQYRIQTFKGGSIINSSFRISVEEFNVDDKTKDKTLTKKTWVTTTNDKQEGYFKVITAGNQIVSKDLLETVLDTSPVFCYWVKNNLNDTLFEYSINNLGSIIPEGDTFIRDAKVSDGNSSRLATILNNGEYFIYTNLTKSTLAIFGPGSMISIPTNLAKDTEGKWSIKEEDQISLDTIQKEGLKSDIPFRELTLRDGEYVALTEMSIITLTANDKLIISSNIDQDKLVLNNTWTKITDAISYETDTVYNLSIGDIDYYIKADYVIPEDQETISLINYSEENVFSLTEGIHAIYGEDEDSSSEITISSDSIIIDDETPATIGGLVRVASNFPWGGLSSSSINLKDLITLGVVKVPKIMYYALDLPEISYDNKSSVIDNLKVDSDTIRLNLWGQSTEDPTKGSSYKFSAKLPFIFNRNSDKPEIEESTTGGLTPIDKHYSYIIPIYFEGNYKNGTNGYSLKVTLTDGTSPKIPIYIYGDKGNKSTDLIISGNKTFYLISFDVNNDVNNESVSIDKNCNLILNLEWTAEEGKEYVTPTNELYLNINPIKVYNGINPNLSLVSDEDESKLESLVNHMNNLVKNSTLDGINVYYINEPDNSLAIQDENIYIPDTNIFNPKFLYDKNNIANILTLPMIDLENSDIYLTKTVKGYREGKL